MLCSGIFLHLLCVGNKVCPGTEREEINSSTADTENTHVETNNGTDSTTKD